MSECYRNLFIKNSQILNTEEFKDEYLNKGKALYEVIRIIDGIPLFLEDHLDRLYNSEKITGLKIWLSKEEIKDSIVNLARVNKISEGNVKIIFNFKEGNKNFLAYFIKHSYPSEEMYNKGVTVGLFFAERENPTAKVINLSLREATDKVIKEKGLFEVILVDKDDFITEGSRSNIFMVIKDKIYTFPKEKVLPGITRNYVIKACCNLGYEVIEKKLNYKEIDSLDGLFISGTSPKVLPINRVENINFNPQNEIIQNIRVQYEIILKDYIKKNKVKS
ncbi:aminotransferase class IV [Clostridium homopropionicum]|nr:aminotransferase class IV [Clostridium homopropionicum]